MLHLVDGQTPKLAPGRRAYLFNWFGQHFLVSREPRRLDLSLFFFIWDVPRARLSYVVSFFSCHPRPASRGLRARIISSWMMIGERRPFFSPLKTPCHMMPTKGTNAPFLSSNFLINDLPFLWDFDLWLVSHLGPLICIKSDQFVFPGSLLRSFGYEEIFYHSSNLPSNCNWTNLIGALSKIVNLLSLKSGE